MAFSMNSVSGGFGGGARGASVKDGDEVPEIITTQLGFKGLNGDTKAKISQSWPADSLPPSYASLFSIAPAHGLYAAAGPDGIVIGSTQSVRDRIYEEGSEAVRNCEPLHTIPHSRPAHVVFSSDESCLVVAEQNSSEIIAYRTADLRAGKSTVALRISINAPARAVTANPDLGQAQFFAVLNTNGQLLLADLGSGQLAGGVNGPVLAENISCVTWSTKGKALVAGKADGTAVQLKPDGSIMASVPKPSSVPSNCHVAQIAWIETDVFYFIYTPSSTDEESPVSEYYLVQTDKKRTEFTFNKSQELIFATIPRTPAHFYVSRLRNYGPHLSEALFVSATVGSDIKMVTKASKPLSDDVQTPDVYATTSAAEDSQNVAMPMGSDGVSDTTPIGMSIDLSDKEPIFAPIPSDPEITDSAVPLPQLAVLNNEGVLSVWALIYDDAVRAKTAYPGFADVQNIRNTLGEASAEAEMEATPSVPQPQVPAAGSTDTKAIITESKSPFAAAQLSAGGGMQPPQTTTSFGQTASSTPSFGQSSTPAFGQASSIGKPTSSWASTGFSASNQQSGNAFGQPSMPGSATKSSFGQPASAKPAFGQTGFGQKPATAFGQPGFGTSSPFGAAAKTESSPFANAGTINSSGFGSFANNNGFAAAKKECSPSPFVGNPSSGSIFGQPNGSQSSPFGGFGTNDKSTFGQATGSSTFGKPAPSPFGAPNAVTASPFASTGQLDFKVQSTFQKDETSKDEDDDDAHNRFGFGGLGGMLSGRPKNPVQSPNKEEEMGDDNENATEVESSKMPQETPPSTINQPKSTTTPHVSSLFGNTQQQSFTPQTQPKSTQWGFGNMPSTTPKDTPAPSKTIFGTKPISDTTPAAVSKSEPNKPFNPFASVGSKQSDSDGVKSLADEEEETPSKLPEAQFSPDPFSKPGYRAGDISASSLNSKGSREPEDAPLPPDFMSANKAASQPPKPEDSELPSEELSSDFEEGSGEDVTGDVSPVEQHESGESDTEEPTEPAGASPESSSGQTPGRSPDLTGGPFTMIGKTDQAKPVRPLFGEMGTSGPIFAPPKPQTEPRSPSPIRKSQPGRLRSPERSFSAPAGPRSVIAQRKQEHQQSPFAAHAAQAREEETAKERARLDASRRAKEEAEALEQQPLVDDEDEILQQELAKPTEPVEHLDPFITHQPGRILLEIDNKGRTDIPSQIEKLYQDINSMVVTLGINAKSLSSYMLYQTGQGPNKKWSDVLKSDTPIDALNDEWYLGGVAQLQEGSKTLDELLDNLQLKDVAQKIEDCQNLLTKETADLRSRITALRRSTQARTQPENTMHAPLSAEQASIQSDLRKSSAKILTDLGQVEDSLVLLRAKLADIAPTKVMSDKQGMLGMMTANQKKPSVEAVMNTVTKMTLMAEKRSADVDVLEAQLKKLNMASTNGAQPSTPERRVARRTPATPVSGATSVYHTPDSKGHRITRTTLAKSDQMIVSSEDRQKLQAKFRRRKDFASMLKAVLQEKNGNPVA